LLTFTTDLQNESVYYTLKCYLGLRIVLKLISSHGTATGFRSGEFTMPPLHPWPTMRPCMPRSAANTRTLSLAICHAGMMHGLLVSLLLSHQHSIEASPSATQGLRECLVSLLTASSMSGQVLSLRYNALATTLQYISDSPEVKAMSNSAPTGVA